MPDYALANTNCDHTSSVGVAKRRDKLHGSVGPVNAFSPEIETGRLRSGTILPPTIRYPPEGADRKT